MAEGGGNNTMAVLVVVLVLALIAVFFLWQRDQESKDLDVEIGAADDAPAMVAKEPPGSRMSRSLGSLRGSPTDLRG